jgi:hypothetical protein
MGCFASKCRAQCRPRRLENDATLADLQPESADDGRSGTDSDPREEVTCDTATITRELRLCVAHQNDLERSLLR